MKTEGPALQVARLVRALEEVVKVTEDVRDDLLSELSDAVDAARETAEDALAYHHKHSAPIRGEG